MPYKDPKSEIAKESNKKKGDKYYNKNRDKILLENKNNPNRLKSSRINNWKRRGIIGDLHFLYDKYINTNNCEKCNLLFIDTKNKCLDHNHITGEFRFVLCRNCNNDDIFKIK